jgi:hypothetical protein
MEIVRRVMNGWNYEDVERSPRLCEPTPIDPRAETRIGKR